MRIDTEGRRRAAIARHLAGESPSAICASVGLSRPWFYKWLKRFESGDAAWAVDRSRRPQASPARTVDEVEASVVAARRGLEAQGLFSGAQAILWELEDQAIQPVPSLRTIGRILVRQGLTARRVGRYLPKGKAYPGPVANRPGSLHQSDFVGPRYVRGPVRFYSLHSVDLATARCAVQPMLQRGSQHTIDAFWAIWGRLGMPDHQQVDNEMVFYGSPAHPRGMGSLIRLCLQHGIEVWFIPPAEPWRNGVVEKFNDLWEARFRRRTPLASVPELHGASLRFEERHNGRYRYSKLGGRTPLASLHDSGATLRFPGTADPPRYPLAKPDRGRYHLVRFVRSNGRLDVFGEHFTAPPEATYEYVRLTVDVERQRLLVYLHHHLVDEHPYTLR